MMNSSPLRAPVASEASRRSALLTVAASFTAALLASAGCGVGSNELEPVRFDWESFRQIPKDLTELDVGEFFVTRRTPTGEQLMIRFHLYALASAAQLPLVQGALATNEKRVRDQVLETAANLELDSFHDPLLRALKSELLNAVQRSARCPHLHELVLSDYSVETR